MTYYPRFLDSTSRWPKTIAHWVGENESVPALPCFRAFDAGLTFNFPLVLCGWGGVLQAQAMAADELTTLGSEHALARLTRRI